MTLSLFSFIESDTFRVTDTVMKTSSSFGITLPGYKDRYKTDDDEKVDPKYESSNFFAGKQIFS